MTNGCKGASGWRIGYHMMKHAVMRNDVICFYDTGARQIPCLPFVAWLIG